MRTICFGLLLGSLVLSACEKASDGELEQAKSDSSTTSPTDKANGALRLKNGEWVSHSRRGWFDPLGEEKQYAYWLSFEKEADPDLRNDSLKELVTSYLLPGAMKQNSASARLIEERHKLSIGPIQSSVTDSWVFKRREGWQWEQVSGPKIDWSVISQELFEHPALRLKTPKFPLKTIWESGDYRLIYHIIAAPELSPKEAMFEITRFVSLQTQCESEPAEQPDFLKDEALDAIIVYAYPETRGDLLKIVPKVHFSLGRKDGVWTCDKANLFNKIEKMDWETMKDWDSFF